MEGRGPAKGNSLRCPENRTQSWAILQAALERIRQAAGRDKKLRLTALWHHVYNIDRLWANIACGWLLTFCLVAGLSGIVRREA